MAAVLTPGALTRAAAPVLGAARDAAAPSARTAARAAGAAAGVLRAPAINAVGRAAAVGANAFDAFVQRGVADLRPMPSSIIDEGPQRAVHRYHPAAGRGQHGPPVLLVPPLAAPTSCFDLRRGCSLVEHFVGSGRPTYVVDYGRISFSDRDLGLEHWVDDVLPGAIRAVAADAGEPVQLVGWCLGGIISLLSVAADPELPIVSVATVASPFDFRRVRLVAPFRPLAMLDDGMIVTTLYRTMGGAPAPLVKAAYRFAALDKQLTKPYALVRNLHDRDFLAQIEAVDAFTANMIAYPGRTFGQLYHRFFLVNELARGRLRIDGRRISLDDVRVPVLSVAGEGDGIAPRAAVDHVGTLLPNAPEVTLEAAPGGHLGVLTGRAARATTWVALDGFLDRTAVAA